MESKPKILLISPTSLDPQGKPIVQKKTYLPGLTLPHLAAITPQNFEVTIVSETSQPIPFTEKWDIVGLTGMGGAGVTRAYQLAEEFRKSGALVVMGGIALTLFNKEETLSHADVVISGEADESWVEFLHDYLDGNVKPSYTMKCVPDITKLPAPAYEKMDLKFYGFWRPVQATRGCPFSCSFCSVSEFFHRSYRKRPVEQVIRDVRAAKKTGSKYIAFIDDNIGVDFNYCKELWTALIPEKIIWISQCSLQIAEDEEMLDLAYRSGCRILSFGVETLNTDSLNHIHKEWNDATDYSSRIRTIRSHGIEVSTEMILGLDGDDIDVFDRTFDFLMKNDISLPRIYILTPVPGTPMYQELKDENRIIDEDIVKYTGGNVVYRPKSMSPQQLQDGYWSVYKRLYSLKNIYKRLRGNPAGLNKFMRLFLLGTNLVYRNHIQKGITPGIV
ncbi:MAG: radical SAM protein [Cyclobacteriaceae bacterium]